ncbi:UNVERIFIED_CONTAM: hypothetical protein K2H54_021503 [Gekko kuhli]
MRVEEFSLPVTGDGFLYSLVSLWWIFGGGTQLTVSGQPASPPTVQLYPPSSEEIKSNGKGTLVCLVNDFHPAAVQVIWLADGTTISNGVETTRAIKANDKYMASSYLSVTSSDWERHDTYTCKVKHEGLDYMKSVSHSQCP